MARLTIGIDLSRMSFDAFVRDVKKVNGTKITLDAKGAEKGIKGVYTAVKDTNKELANSQKLLNNFTQYLTTRLFNAIGTSLKSALSEMKAIDTQMVTIQKVTKMSADEMAQLADKANDVAKALGATASAYLEAVAAFSKAGYADQADELGELAIQAAKAGNTTQEIANQFLLSVDKAYKFNGQIKELATVLDGANEIGNRFATDVEHIAQGLGKVSSIASQAHVGINELTSAIGTITAVTQRSGNEAATALRALFLNIIGDTKTEIEDGATWTAGEIEGLRDVIKLYAKDAYDAAQATGSVINPMEAIAGLAQSMKDGLLTEAKLMEMVSDIGGKLRSSQLLALIQNFDMYQEMMETYATSAGSVAEEYAIYLDSWQAKTDQLKATWTEFVENILSTDTIKNAIQALTDVIEFLDSDLGHFVLTLGALAAVIKVLSATTAFGGLIAGVKSFGDAVALVQIGVEGLTAAMAANPLFAVGLGVVAIFGIKKAMDALGLTVEGQKARVEDLTEKVENLRSEYEKLVSKDALNEQEQRHLTLLEKEIELNERILQQEAQKAYEMERTGSYDFVAPDGNTTTLPGAPAGQASSASRIGGQAAGISQLRAEYEGLINVLSIMDKESAEYAATLEEAQKVEDKLNKATNAYEKTLVDTAKTLQEYEELGVELTDEDKQLLGMLEALLGVFDDSSDSVSKYVGYLKDAETATNEFTTSLDGIKTFTDSEIFVSLADSLNIVKTALDEMSESGVISESTLRELIKIHPELQSELVMTEGGLRLNESAVQDLIRAELSQYMTEQGASAAAAVIASAESTKQQAIDATTGAIYQQISALAQLGVYTQYAGGGWSSLDGATESAANPAYAKMRQVEIQSAKAAARAWEILHSQDTTGGGKRTGGGGGSGAATKQVDEYLEALKAQISAEQTKLSLMEQQGKSSDELIAKRRHIQALLHKEAEYLRATGASQEEIDKLSIEWWKINDEINDILEEEQKKLQEIADDLKDELEDAVDDLLDKAKKTRDEALAELDAELDILKQQNEARQNANELEEKKNAILEAQKNLQNALNERTVRYYNASTGQWEWGANATNVASAREALANAQSALSDYQQQRRQDRLEAEIERRKDQINETYDAIEEEWKSIIASMEEPSRSIGEILQDIAEHGTPELQRQISNVSILMGRLAQYMAGAFGGAAEGTYDSGGLLRGVGLKATSQDEMILPPDLTRAMVSTTSTGMVARRLDELRYLYGAGSGQISGSTFNRVGTQYNGDIYQMNGYTISEDKARTTTVYDFVRMSRSLGIYKNAN